MPPTSPPRSRRATNSPAIAIHRRGAAPGDFDAKRAMGYLEDVCKIGPRISGTDGMKKQQELIQKHFESAGRQGRAAGVQGHAR